MYIYTWDDSGKKRERERENARRARACCVLSERVPRFGAQLAQGSQQLRTLTQHNKQKPLERLQRATVAIPARSSTPDTSGTDWSRGLCPQISTEALDCSEAVVSPVTAPVPVRCCDIEDDRSLIDFFRAKDTSSAFAAAKRQDQLRCIEAEQPTQRQLARLRRGFFEPAQKPGVSTKKVINQAVLKRVCVWKNAEFGAT